MHDQTPTCARTGSAARNLLRIVIASYFMVVALGLIPGTDFAVLALLIAPAQVASVMTAILVFSLSFMVMVGVHTRGAALLLGLMTFFAAYVSLPDFGSMEGLGAFWRDLALIAALMLTYSEPVPAAARSRARSRGKVVPRRIAAGRGHGTRPAPALPLFASTRAQALRAAGPKVTSLAEARERMTRPTDLRAPLAPEEIDNIFEDDRVGLAAAAT